ncbi:hypothetical protein ACOJIV_18160 [Haloarcula sp. AONF1]
MDDSQLTRQFFCTVLSPFAFAPPETLLGVGIGALLSAIALIIAWHFRDLTGANLWVVYLLTVAVFFLVRRSVRTKPALQQAYTVLAIIVAVLFPLAIVIAAARTMLSGGAS